MRTTEGATRETAASKAACSCASISSSSAVRRQRQHGNRQQRQQQSEFHGNRGVTSFGGDIGWPLERKGNSSSFPGLRRTVSVTSFS